MPPFLFIYLYQMVLNYRPSEPYPWLSISFDRRSGLQNITAGTADCSAGSRFDVAGEMSQIPRESLQLQPSEAGAPTRNQT